MADVRLAGFGPPDAPGDVRVIPAGVAICDDCGLEGAETTTYDESYCSY
jgi:hypothetical protein